MFLPFPPIRPTSLVPRDTAVDHDNTFVFQDREHDHAFETIQLEQKWLWFLVSVLYVIIFVYLIVAYYLGHSFFKDFKQAKQNAAAGSESAANPFGDENAIGRGRVAREGVELGVVGGGAKMRDPAPVYSVEDLNAPGRAKVV